MDRAALIAEAKRQRLLAQVKAQRDQAKAAAAPPVAATPEPEAPGLLARSRDRLAQGASDLMSTATSETYGRKGDPTQRDVMAPSARLMKALGGDVIPAVGSVIADTATTAGKAVLPQAAEDAIAGAAQTVSQSAPVQAAGNVLRKWKAASPDTYAAAGEIANVASVLAPMPKPALTTGTRANQRLAATLARKRKAETTRMLTPDDPYEQGNLIIKDNAWKTQEFVPGQRYEGVIDEVTDIPGVNPRKSHTENVNALEAHVSDINQQLGTKLADAAPIPAADVAQTLTDSVARASGELTLVADAGKYADSIYAKFNELIATKIDPTGNISPSDLLQARRELDNWLKRQATDVFSPGGTASKVATREIRQSINQLVDASAPGLGVGEDLARMNKALEARDVLRPRAVREPPTALGRYMATLEESTGLKHPVNPQSAYITAANPVVGAATGTAALVLGLRRGLGESWMKFNARMEKLLQDAINNGAPPAERAAIVAAMNQEKEKRNAPRR